MIIRGKRGQLAIFIIIAILIVGAILILLLFPEIRTKITGGGEVSPQAFLKACLEPEIKANIDALSSKGGYINPEGVLTYQGEKIKYLCYTSEYYKTCSVQEPMIKNRFEKELEKSIKAQSTSCMDELKADLEGRGYEVSIGKTDFNSEVIPGKIKLIFTAPITLTKAGESQKFDRLETSIASEMYDLLFTAQSIVDFESAYGDSEITQYMQYYPDLKIEKLKLSDGSKIYKITNVITKESFRFASRSL